jgi:hypothetical protein
LIFELAIFNHFQCHVANTAETKPRPISAQLPRSPKRRPRKNHHERCRRRRQGNHPPRNIPQPGAKAVLHPNQRKNPKHGADHFMEKLSESSPKAAKTSARHSPGYRAV